MRSGRTASGVPRRRTPGARCRARDPRTGDPQLQRLARARKRPLLRLTTFSESTPSAIGDGDRHVARCETPQRSDPVPQRPRSRAERTTGCPGPEIWEASSTRLVVDTRSAAAARGAKAATTKPAARSWWSPSGHDVTRANGICRTVSDRNPYRPAVERSAHVGRGGHRPHRMRRHCGTGAPIFSWSLRPSRQRRAEEFPLAAAVRAR